MTGRSQIQASALAIVRVFRIVAPDLPHRHEVADLSFCASYCQVLSLGEPDSRLVVADFSFCASYCERESGRFSE